MGFPLSVREKVLLKCHRICCLCHSYAGIKMELHHIRPRAQGGEDTEENCIPLCLLCHGEVGLYNPNHPKGLKYTENELKARRDELYDLVSKEEYLTLYSEEDINKAKNLMIGCGEILEYCIQNDPCGQYVSIIRCADVEDLISDLRSYKWSFTSRTLNLSKDNLIENLFYWDGYISNERYFHTNANPEIFSRIFNSNTINEIREDFMIIINAIQREYKTLRTAAEQQIY